MGPRHILLTAALLAQALPPEASQYCGRLEYWNPDNKRCSSCLQRFGPPRRPDYEFRENCGLSDLGDQLQHPFKKCAPGQCNPNGADLCSPCGGGATVSTLAEGGRRSASSCIKRSVPPKKACCPTSRKDSVPSSQEPSSPTTSLWTSDHRNIPADTSLQVLQDLALPVVLVLLVSSLILLFTLRMLRHCRQQKSDSFPCPRLACSGPHNPFPLHSSSLVTLKVLEAGEACKVSLLPLQCTELPILPSTLASQPLSRLLDELEVLEELIMLLDPEPGPGGGMACGTTRHLAARYGMPATWSTFAYSLRPSRSPLLALLEMVVAREPTASLGQLGAHLAHLGRADALQVLSKLS
ncbi:IGF-like family receptor 1 isoform X2 [Dasypus novemcinctus]|uniref:IGF-like family receptor 1 isoform X2 n=1 Tax=Dasypus novemcinctus TaxID=9361 RepID=UPI0003CC1795|nr:IGF-like family receptor 1 isoform X2 [Dasypus novemcinctus]